MLEVKGYFRHAVRRTLQRTGRGYDYLEIGLESPCQWNPLDDPDLDSYSLAYTLSTLLNQRFGKSKEPFWQQAYTNLVRWIIDLHRHAELAKAIHPAANRITAKSPSAGNSLSGRSRSRAAVPLRSVPRAAFRP